jgi:carboxypeptidase C (cathepsin A)
MRTNPNLKVLSVNGYYDFATPFAITEYDLAHMNLDPTLRGNLQLLYYPSGHMIYLNTEALTQLKHDLTGFYDRAAPAR